MEKKKKDKESLWDKIMYMDTFVAAWVFGLMFVGLFLLIKEVLLA